ncbi:MAG: hypothetical protein KF709_12630 [Gemmatimonadaceae bacterium]|nr:hypothetical protein [Gemmatimonadaceae bacterium]
MKDRRSGFTVLELAIALSLTAMLLLTAVTSLDGLRRLTTVTQQRAVQLSEFAIGYHVLRDLLGTTQVGLAKSDRFSGDSRSVSVLALCRTAGGWRERCRASISLSPNGEHTRVSWSSGRGTPQGLFDVAGIAEFRFSDPGGAGAGWQSSWGTGTAAPRLVALVASSDTMFFSVGSR